jgi:hypothetical protein
LRVDFSLCEGAYELAKGAMLRGRIEEIDHPAALTWEPLGRKPSLGDELLRRRPRRVMSPGCW